jgi:glycine/D-amino acid oxidase-like deaminating enzyme
MAEHVDCVVVGAGVVGLAVARALALAGREVLVLEAEDPPSAPAPARATARSSTPASTTRRVR